MVVRRSSFEAGEPGAGAGRFLLAEDAAHLVEGGVLQGLGLERGGAGEQFVEEDAEGVDVGAGVDVGGVGVGAGLLRAHVGRGADHLLEAGEERLVGEVGLHRLGDAEVDHLGHRLGAVLDGDEDVAGLEVAVDDAFLVGVLDGAADLEEELEALRGCRASRGRRSR